MPRTRGPALGWLAVGWALAAGARAQPPPPPGLIFADTPEQLRDAFTLGAKHIVVRSHLDLTGQTVSSGTPLYTVKSTTQTLSGRCTDDPPQGSPRQLWASKGCALKLDHAFLALPNGTPAALWIDKLVMHLPVPRSAADKHTLLDVAGAGAKVWVTNTTLAGGQGPWQVRGAGLAAGSQALFKDCVFTDIRYDNGAAAAVADASSAGVGAAVSFNRSLFSDNGVSTPIAGIVAVAGTQANHTVAFQDCTFDDSGAAPLWVRGAATDVYAEPPLNYTTPPDGATVAAAPLSALRAPSSALLTLDDSQFLQLRSMRDTAVRAATAPRRQAVAIGGSDGLSAPVIAAIVVCCAFVLLTIALGVLFVWWMRRRRGARAADLAESLSAKSSSPDGRAVSTPSPQGKWADRVKSWSTVSGAALDLQSSRAHSNLVATTSALSAPARGPSRTDAVGSRHGSLTAAADADALPATRAHSRRSQSSSRSPLSGVGVSGVMSASASAPPAPPPARPLTLAEAREQLETVLDAMHEKHERLVERFYVLRRSQRQVGLNSIIQHVDRAQDGLRCVAKFYTSRQAFLKEKEIFERADIRPPLASVVLTRDSGVTSASHSGFHFPPLIVMERGEALHDWTERVEPGLLAKLCALACIAERVHHMHSAGLCHRDIKPAHILWRQRSQCWSLVDFGCAAEIGQPAQLAYTLQYAPPEAVNSDDLGESAVLASGAQDIWALGVVAYELMTGQAAFGEGAGDRDVRAQLLGRAPLAWEEQGGEERLKELQVLRPSVLRCLSRNPSQRPSSRKLVTMWSGIFDILSGKSPERFMAELSGAVQP